MNTPLLTNPYGHHSHSILLLATNRFMLNQQDCLVSALQAHPVSNMNTNLTQISPTAFLNGGIRLDSEQAAGQSGQTRRVTSAPVLILPPLCALHTVPGLSCLGDVVSPSLFLGQRHRGSGCFSASRGLSEVCFPRLTQTELES